MMPTLLGLDIGTSAVKAALFDLQGSLLVTARRPQPLFMPYPDWAEQDPQDWWLGVQQTVQQVLAGRDPRQVLAVGLSAQCPGHVLVDSTGRAIGKAIIWRDQRARDEAGWIRRHITTAEAEQWTGSGFLADPSRPPARLVWLKNHRPEAWKQARWLLEPKDTIAFLLTGEAATDVHTAYCLAHDQNRQYNPDYCDRLGIEMHKLPAVRSVTEILGVVTPRAAELTGLCPGTPVVTGTIDAFCDTIAGGALLPGKAVDVAGTSEIAALGVSTHEIPVHDVLKAQANPTHPTQPCPQGAGVFATRMGEAGAFFSGPSQAGGDTLRWLAEGFFPEAAASGGGLPAALPVLEKAAASCPPGCAGLVFVPYLCGERAPVWDSTLRGAFLGISIEHNRAYFARAVYEGVACVVRHILEACETASGQPAEQVVVCGGGSASRFWNQVKANILEKEVIPSAVQETAALGAAMIASVAVGAYPTLREASQRLFRAGQPVEPEPGSQEWARETYEKYLEYVRQRPRAEA